MFMIKAKLFSILIISVLCFVLCNCSAVLTPLPVGLFSNAKFPLGYESGYNGDQAALVEPGCEVVTFLDLLDRLAGLKSDRRDRHLESLVNFLRAGRIPIVAAGSNIAMIAFFTGRTTT